MIQTNKQTKEHVVYSNKLKVIPEKNLIYKITLLVLSVFYQGTFIRHQSIFGGWLQKSLMIDKRIAQSLHVGCHVTFTTEVSPSIALHSTENISVIYLMHGCVTKEVYIKSVDKHIWTLGIFT